MRVFLDANVLISALLRPEGPPGQVLSRCYEGRFELVASVHLLAELRRALGYPKIRALVRREKAEVARWIEGLEDLADVVDDVPVIARTSRDPDDDRHLAAALAGRADVLVTGDRDLLSVGAFEGVRILAPAVFLALLDRLPPG